MKTKIILLFILCVNAFSQMPSIKLKYNYRNDKNDTLQQTQYKPLVTTTKILDSLFNAKKISKDKFDSLIKKTDISHNVLINKKIEPLKDSLTIFFSESLKAGKITQTEYDLATNEINEATNASSESLSLESKYRNLIEEIYTKKIESLIIERNKLMDKPSDTEEDFFLLKSRVDAITSEIKKLEEKKQYELDKLIKISSRWFPTIARKNRKRFFEEFYENDVNKTKYINALYLTADSESSTIQTELITDYMNALRIVFGNVLTSNNQSEINNSTQATQIETFKTFINGGGNFFLDFNLPVYTNFYKEKKFVNWYSYFSLKGATYLKNFSGNIDTSTANGSFGVCNYFDFASENGKFSFFVNANINYTVGDKEFYKNLSLSNEKPFLNGKIIAGITFINTFRLSATLSNFGSDPGIRKEKIMVGLQILPNYK